MSTPPPVNASVPAIRAQSSQEPSPPIQLNDRYTDHREIGRGGMGVVMAAYDQDVRRDVAIKFLHGKQSSDERISRFVQEGQVTGQLEHPNIVPVHDVGIDEAGTVFMSMKLVRGRSLQQVLTETATAVHAGEACPFPLDERLDVFRKVADAIGYAHSRGVIHRDLKPANIMVGEFGEVLVMDWGLSRITGGVAENAVQRPVESSEGLPVTLASESLHALADAVDEAGDTAPVPGTSPGTPRSTPRSRPRPVKTDHQTRPAGALTVEGQAMGTPGYMSPEQHRGMRGLLDARTDIYALGALLYELLTLTPAFPGKPLQRMSRQLEGPPEPGQVRANRTFGRGRVEVPRELDAIAGTCLSLRVRDRYETVRAMLEDIERYRANRPVSVLRDPWRSRLAKWIRRHPTRSATIGITAVLLAVGGLVTSVLVSELRAQSDQREMERVLAESRELQARMRIAALHKDYTELMRLTGENAHDSRDQILQQFQREWRRAQAERPGSLFGVWVDELPRQQIDGYIEILQQLFEAHDRYGVDVTDEDHAYLAVLLSSRPVGDVTGGLEHYARAIELSPGRALHRINRATLRLKNGDSEGALEDLNVAIAIDRSASSAWSARAAVYLSLGDERNAMDDATTAINLSPSFAEPYNMRGVARLRLHDWQGALADFNRYVRLSPSLADGWVNRGRANQELGRVDDARADFDRCLSIDARNTSALTYRGLLYTDTGKADAAVEDFTAALAVDPTLTEARHGRALAYRVLGQTSDALRDFDELVRGDPHEPSWLVERGRLHAATGDTDAALDDMIRAIQVNDQDPSFFANRALVYTARHNLTAALADYDRSLELDSHQPGVLINRGLLHMEQHNPQRALQDFNAAHELDPANGGALGNRANARLLLGDTSGAIADYDAVLALSPTDWRAYAQKGRVLQQVGRRAEAQKAYEAAVRNCKRPGRAYTDHPVDPRSRRTLAHLPSHSGGVVDGRRDRTLLGPAV